MEKLKLTLDDLAVTSFHAQEEREGTGTVKGMEFSMGNPWSGCYECPSFVETQCPGLDCSQAEGCVQSAYCSYIGPGMPNNTCYEGCVTDNYHFC